jgi:transcription termination factor NusB
MSSRHIARSIVLQSLYELDFNSARGQDGKEKNLDINKVIERNIKEFGLGIEEQDFINNLAHGVLKHQPQIDDIIIKYWNF